MRVRDRRFRPALETLEQRDLMAGGLHATLYNGYLYLQDSQRRDYIGVTQTAGRLVVSDNGARIPVAVGDHSAWDVSAENVRAVAIYSYGGGAVVNLAESRATAVRRDAFVYAYGGHNVVVGGSGNNVLYGYDGSNTLSGGSGTNYLIDGSSYDQPDTFYGASGFNWYWRPFNAGDPFASGVSVSDIQQGQSPTCQTLAALGEALSGGHDFTADIAYAGNSLYRVQLHDGSGAQIVYFDGYCSENDPVVRAGSADFWQVLETRARLQELGVNPYVAYTPAQWDQINLQTHGQLYSVDAALTAFTGQASSFHSIREAAPQAMYDAVARGNLLVASSAGGDGYVSADGIIGDHAYSVLSVYWQDHTWKVELYNPWGVDGLNGRTIDALGDGVAPRDDGFITLSWQQFIDPNNFNGYSQAGA